MIPFAFGTSPKLALDPDSVLDIGDCIVDGCNLAPGEEIVDDGDPRILRALHGFMFSCGPDHIRHPSPMPDGASKYPLHGSFAGHPAKMLWAREEDGHFECRADIDLITKDGNPIRLERLWRIESDGEVHLYDRVVNTGEQTIPVFQMYHMNIGAKWLGEKTELRGEMLENGGHHWRFGEEPGSVFCVPTVADAYGWAEIVVGPIEAIGGRSLRLRFRHDTLPYLQLWRRQLAPANVVGLEPVSHRLAPREELEASGEFNMLAPGKSRSYELRFAFVA